MIVKEYEAEEIWADYEYNDIDGEEVNKEFVESKHYFELCKKVNAHRRTIKRRGELLEEVLGVIDQCCFNVLYEQIEKEID